MVASQETDRITVPWNSRPRNSSEWTKHGFGKFSAFYEHEHSHGKEPSRYRRNREDRRQFHHCRSHTPTISKGQLVQKSLRYECSTFHLRCAWCIPITQLYCSREMSVSRWSRCYLWYKIFKISEYDTSTNVRWTHNTFTYRSRRPIPWHGRDCRWCTCCIFKVVRRWHGLLRRIRWLIAHPFLWNT